MKSPPVLFDSTNVLPNLGSLASDGATTYPMAIKASQVRSISIDFCAMLSDLVPATTKILARRRPSDVMPWKGLNTLHVSLGRNGKRRERKQPCRKWCKCRIYFHNKPPCLVRRHNRHIVNPAPD